MRSTSCRRLIVRGSWTSRISSASRSPHTWSEETTLATDAWIEAHHAWSRGGEAERAARCAFWQALGLFFRGDLAPAMGWVARGGRVLEDSRGESVEQAWLRMLTALPRLFEGDADVYSSFVDAGAIAERFADPDATMFARLCRGYALILQGRVADGVALLDEVMVSVTADEVAPILAGIAYCQVIALCQAVFDLRRAREWTDALTRWCDSQPDLVPVPGQLSSSSLRDLPAAGRVDGRSRVRPPSAGVARRAAGMGRARIGLLPAGRDPAAARRAHGGGGVIPPGKPGWTRPRARDVLASLGAGAS